MTVPELRRVAIVTASQGIGRSQRPAMPAMRLSAARARRLLDDGNFLTAQGDMAQVPIMPGVSSTRLTKCGDR
jgi:hypothetical protein